MRICGRFLSLLVALVLVAACTETTSSGGPSIGGNPAPALAAPDVVTLRLAEAAERAASALNNISQIEQAQRPAPPVEDYSMAPPELLEPVSVTWTGPVEQFLRTMSNRIGYGFRSIGAAPPVPITVRIDEYQQPLIKLIKSASLQVTGKADVVLDASRRAVELRYAPTDGY